MACSFEFVQVCLVLHARPCADVLRVSSLFAGTTVQGAFCPMLELLLVLLDGLRCY